MFCKFIVIVDLAWSESIHIFVVFILVAVSVQTK